MLKLIAFVSGKVQEVGYRARIVDIANAFGLKGMVENQKDGRVKIIAEVDDEKLKWFESAIDINNTLIYVSSIEKVYSPACNEFDNFGKQDELLDEVRDINGKFNWCWKMISWN